MKLIITLLVISFSFLSFDAQSQCDGAIFEERNGIAIMEAETITTSGWTILSDGSATGGAYLAYTGNDNFDNPGVNTLTYKVKINSPGTYRFIWRNRIGIISNSNPTTEHNDSWLKIDASDFYGQSGSSRIYPAGSGKTPNPNGAGSGGWFKVYTNTIDWSFSTNTSDNDPHNIYATFNSAGVYDILVSGRSNGHYIDRLVLYKEDIYSASEAESLTRAETRCDGSAPPPPPPPPPTGTAEINSFTLYNANTDVAIGTLSNGSVIDLSQTNNVPLTVVANTTGSVSTVEFQLSGPISILSRTEEVQPFALFGDIGTDYEGSLFPVGSYTLTATSTTSSGASNVVTVNFTVVNNTPPPSGETFSFVLIDPNTDQDIFTLNNGSNVTSGSNVNIRAVSPFANTASVYFELQGASSQTATENVAPYALFGDVNGDYISGFLADGSYTLRATAYSGSDRSGTNLGSTSINFTVGNNANNARIGQGTAAAAARQSAQIAEQEAINKLTVAVFPNPAPNHFTLNIRSNNSTPVIIRVLDMLGRVMETRAGVPANGSLQLRSNYRPGTYLAQIIQGTEKVTLKLVKGSD